MFIGTGNEGKVFRDRSAGQGHRLLRQRRSSRPTRWRRRPTAASTSPRLPTAGSTRSIATARRRRSSIRDDKYIWSLAVDAKGKVFAGTGEKGVIYKITPDGTGTPFYQTKATHAMALAVDRAGNLLVGTGSPGRVLRVDRGRQGLRPARLAVPGNARAALRRQGQVVRRPRSAAGTGGGAAPAPTIGAGVSRLTTGRAPVPSVSVSTEMTSFAVVDAAGASTTAASAREDRRASKGADLPHRAGRTVGSALGVARRRAVRSRVRRANGALDRRHRQQGQDLPPRRRSGAADAARPRQRAAGHGVLQGRARPAVLRDREPRQAVPAVVGARRRAAPTSRNRATRRWCRPGER